MDKVALIHRRKKRYLAQMLGAFDAEIGKLVPADVGEAFKGMVRAKMHALAIDAGELLSLREGEELNGYAIELRDQLARSTAQRSNTA